MNSTCLSINWRDLGHGFLTAVIAAVLAAAASALQGGSWPDWHTVLTVAALAGISYLAKQLHTNSGGALGPDPSGSPPRPRVLPAALLSLLSLASPAAQAGPPVLKSGQWPVAGKTGPGNATVRAGSPGARATAPGAYCPCGLGCQCSSATDFCGCRTRAKHASGYG